MHCGCVQSLLALERGLRSVGNLEYLTLLRFGTFFRLRLVEILPSSFMLSLFL